MLNSFVHLSPQLITLLADHWLVTPNERLAREYRRGFELHMLTTGATTWRAPKILSLSQFLRECYDGLCERDHHQLSVLSAEQLLRLAYASLPQHLASVSVSNLLTNWSTLNEYALPIPDDTHAEMFARWCRKFDSAIKTSQQAIPAALGAHLAEAKYSPPSPIIIVAFEQLTVPQREYFEFLCDTGRIHGLTADGSARLALMTSAHELTMPIKSTDVDPNALELFSADSLNDELTAAATWALDKKKQNPNATVGIVVPSLEKNHAQVGHIIGSTLDPVQGSLSANFDISGGQPLSSQPVWLHATWLFGLLLDTANYRLTNLLWSSPFFQVRDHLGDIERWPQKLGRAFEFSQLLRLRKTQESQALLDLQTKLQIGGTFHEVVTSLHEALQLLGWPNIVALDSHQYQAFQHIDSVITKILSGRQIDVEPTHFSAKAVLGILNHILREQMFAPERPPADIQILGMLETTGLVFTHLWICGMDANSFPGNHVRRSFIRPTVAAAHQIPRSTYVAENQFCQQLQHQWLEQSAVTRFSFSTRMNDTEVPPSPLFDGCAVSPIQSAIYPWARRKIALQHYADDFAPLLTEQPKRTGVRLLQAHAECAFKSFAIFRLGLEDQRQPALILDALGRGNLAHNVLHQLVRKFPSSEALKTVSAEDISVVIDQALSELPITLPTDFAHNEKERQTRLVLSWLELEQNRSPFTVEGLEASHKLELAGLQFNVRIDRKDRITAPTLVPNNLLVIDYKTGTASASGLESLPLQAVQLPMYALLDSQVGGVAYGLVRDQARLQGLGSEEMPDVAPTKTNWTALTRQWASELNRLADQFMHGFAQVEPASSTACQYCHLKSVCRIQQQEHEIV